VTIAVQQLSQTASETSIGWATAVTTDPAGDVYFISSNTVFRVDSKGVLTRIAGNLHPGYSVDGGPAIDAQLFTDDLISEAPFLGMPSGLAIDSKGNLYISDGGNARVRKVSADGIITTVAGNGTRGYSGDGGPGSSAQISNPRGLTVDADGNLYIADTNTVRKLSAEGIISTAAPYLALGVALDNGGNLFTVDSTRVRKFSPDGSVTTVAGGTGIIGVSGDGGPATSAAFIGPTTIAVDRSGNLFIGDVSRVRKVSPDGIVSTVAGGGNNNPGEGGPATSAQISVGSIAVDASANLYIAGYGRVRKVSPGGTVTTVAGNGK
jgi:sugar lactone lactonase YvrE